MIQAGHEVQARRSERNNLLSSGLYTSSGPLGENNRKGENMRIIRIQKLRIMMISVIPKLVDALGTVPKSLENRL